MHGWICQCGMQIGGVLGYLLSRNENIKSKYWKLVTIQPVVTWNITQNGLFIHTQVDRFLWAGHVYVVSNFLHSVNNHKIHWTSTKTHLVIPFGKYISTKRPLLVIMLSRNMSLHFLSILTFTQLILHTPKINCATDAKQVEGLLHWIYHTHARTHAHTLSLTYRAIQTKVVLVNLWNFGFQLLNMKTHSFTTRYEYYDGSI